MDINNLDFSSKKLLIKSLSTAIEEIENKMAVTKSFSLRNNNNRTKYSGYLIAANTLKGVISGVKSSELKRVEAKDMIQAAFKREKNADTLDTVGNKASYAITSMVAPASKRVFKAEKSASDIEATSITNTPTNLDPDEEIKDRVKNLKSYKKDLPASINGTFSVVYVPVVPLFKNLAISNSKILNEAGFKTIHFAGSDLEGYVVIDKQAILLFDYDKYNKVHLADAEEIYEEAIEQFDSDLEDWNLRYKAWKQKRVTFDSEMVDYEDQMHEYHTKISVYQKLLAEHKKTKAHANYVARVTKEHKIAVESYENSHTKDEEKPELKLTHNRTDFKKREPEAPVKPNEPPVKFTPKPSRPEKPKAFNTGNLSDIVNKLLLEFNEEMSVSYELASDQFKINPNNSKLHCFWLVEKWKMKNLTKHFGKVSIANWGFTF